MSFHDDSHILSQLGILDSSEKSPKRNTEFTGNKESQKDKQKFVDVKLTSISDSEENDSGSDIFFDRNNLLSNSKRQNPSLIRGRTDNHTVRFIVLAILFLVGGIANASSTLSSCSLKHEVIGCLWICVGILTGFYITKYVSFSSNLMLFLFASLIITLINSYITFNYAFLYAVRGFFIGSVLYGGLIIWFALWRKNSMQLLILFMFFSAGGLLAMTAQSNGLLEATNNVVLITRSIGEFGGRVKRAALENESRTLLPFGAIIESNVTETSNVTEKVSTIKKPEVATGNVQKVKTKTEENAEKQKEIETNKNIEKSVLPENSTEFSTESVTTTSESLSTVTTTETATTTFSSTTTPTTTSTTATPTTTSTTAQPTTKTLFTINVNARKNDENIIGNAITSTVSPLKCPTISLFLDGHVDSDEANSAILRTSIVFAVFIFGFSYILCCLPCGVHVDSKIKKLEGDSIVGLRMRLRMSIAAIQTIVGFLQQILHFHPYFTNDEKMNNKNSEHFIICVSIFFNSLILVLLGKRSSKVHFVFFSFFVLAIGKLTLLIWSPSILGLTAVVCGLYSLWISLFLTMEVSLNSRSTVQLAYFLIAWVLGRILACGFSIQPSIASMESFVVLILIVLIGVLLFYSTRLLMKATRLKEILDNSDAPIVSNSATSGGEYISLTAQDVIDEDSDDTDELDQSSMNLDFELEELGMEPVGIGSNV